MHASANAARHSQQQVTKGKGQTPKEFRETIRLNYKDFLEFHLAKPASWFYLFV